MKLTQAPCVFDYRDLSEYLKDIYKYRKATEAGFSYEKWADEIGLKSRSHLRYLVLGEKSAANSMLPLLLNSLKLTEDETAHFVNLFHLQIATTPEIKAVYIRQIFKVWVHHLETTDILNFSEFLSDPIIPQLFAYLSFEDAPTDIQQWSRDLQCDVERVQNALRCLIWQKLVEGRVSENGETSYATTSPYFRIPSSDGNTYLRAFHLEGIKQAEEVARGNPENRKLYSTFVALSSEQYQRAQQLIQDFNLQLLALFDEKTLNGKKLYRLNQQLLSVSAVVQTKLERE
jgi:uncharacterized protein (TIGR02147 family)